MTYHYHGIDAEESTLTKSLPNLGTWALPNLFFKNLFGIKTVNVASQIIKNVFYDVTMMEEGIGGKSQIEKLGEWGN